MVVAPHPVPFAISPECAARVRVGLVRAEPVVVSPAGAALAEEMSRLAAGLAAEHAGLAPAAIPGIEPARQLYRAFGIDPTRTRPSSEALLRRAVGAKPLPTISNAVDVCNLCALRFLLPIGLYDLDRVRGSVLLRAGKPGETYAGIRKDEVHLEGRPVLIDEEGPFGNPTSDSRRTSVTETTRSLWMVIFAPADFPGEALAANVEITARTIERHLAGREPLRIWRALPTGR